MATGELPAYLSVGAGAPRGSNLEWFRTARFGLFVHYGLYSLLGRGEWVQFHERIPIAEYAKLADRFTAAAFDAEEIAVLAADAGMTYITFVCKHCDSFSLWDTAETEFSSVRSAARRNLVAEVAEACRRHGLGFFPFYEHGFDWRHPHGPAPWDWSAKSVRPHYDPPDRFYASREEYDFGWYLDYAARQIDELLTGYGPVSGLWLDGPGIPVSGDRSRFHLPELYAAIRARQPHALIAYKWGVNGDEDFLAPEESQLDRISGLAEAPTAAELPQPRTDATPRLGRPVEVCATMQKGPWGFKEGVAHLSPDEVINKLDRCASMGANLLLNVGPLGDGSLHPDDADALREVGRRLRATG